MNSIDNNHPLIAGLRDTPAHIRCPQEFFLYDDIVYKWLLPMQEVSKNIWASYALRPLLLGIGNDKHRPTSFASGSPDSHAHPLHPFTNVLYQGLTATGEKIFMISLVQVEYLRQYLIQLRPEDVPEYPEWQPIEMADVPLPATANMYRILSEEEDVPNGAQADHSLVLAYPIILEPPVSEKKSVQKGLSTISKKIKAEHRRHHTLLPNDHAVADSLRQRFLLEQCRLHWLRIGTVASYYSHPLFRDVTVENSRWVFIDERTRSDDPNAISEIAWILYDGDRVTTKDHRHVREIGFKETLEDRASLIDIQRELTEATKGHIIVAKASTISSEAISLSDLYAAFSGIAGPHPLSFICQALSIDYSSEHTSLEAAQYVLKCFRILCSGASVETQRKYLWGSDSQYGIIKR